MSSSYSAPRASQWSKPVDIGATWHRRRLAEHLAGIEAGTARAALAIELDDREALERAGQEVVRETRLAESAWIKGADFDSWAEGRRR